MLTDIKKTARSRIILAVDVSDPGKALDLVQPLIDHVDMVKLGLEFWTSIAMDFILTDGAELAGLHGAYKALFMMLNGKIMDDWKLHDTSNTMGRAALNLARMKSKYLTVHASAEIDGMIAAVKACKDTDCGILAVTVLTSLSEEQANLTFNAPSKAKVLQFARNAVLAGCAGIVCSPQELEIIGKRPELEKLVKITPGVRPEGSAQGDQKRILTPSEAIRLGADKMVIGRPITDDPDPIAATERIVDEIAEALMEVG